MDCIFEAGIFKLRALEKLQTLASFCLAEVHELQAGVDITEAIAILMVSIILDGTRED